MQLIVVALLLLVLVLTGLGVFLLWYYLRINKAIDVFLEKGNIKDARNVLFSHIEATKELEKLLRKSIDRIASLENSSKISLQKIGVVRFKPFGNRGGNQSFAVALLDYQNNGFVISSLFIQEGSRVFAKEVINGASDHVLSAEEKEAIARAIGSENSK
jgi:hypothetical protein